MAHQIQITGLDFVGDVLNNLWHGICPACQRGLPPGRAYAFTCDMKCHERWIDALITRFGATREITDVATGRVYIVPTRRILTEGITYDDLKKFPHKH